MVFWVFEGQMGAEGQEEGVVVVCRVVTNIDNLCLSLPTVLARLRSKESD
jgi:hypothetical protein